MKHCYKWMVGCALIAVTVFYVLPSFGVQIAAMSLLVPLLLVGCCVLPMVFMMKTKSPKRKGGCCGEMDTSKTSLPNAKEKTSISEKPSCH